MIRADFLSQLADRKAQVPHGVDTSVSAIRLGECALACLPGEAFVELGLEIKKCSPIPRTLVAELVNGEIGYLPTRAAFDDGGYQTSTVARMAPGSGERLVEEARAALQRIAS